MMPLDVMDRVVGYVTELGPDVVDVTGGAPELHPLLPGFISDVREAGCTVRLRTNLTALRSRGEALLDDLEQADVSLLASVPDPHDRGWPGRDPSLWTACIETLRMLNTRGWGRGRHTLDIAWTSSPDLGRTSRVRGETDLERALADEGVAYDELVRITTMPIGRFAESNDHGGVEGYLSELAAAFEPATALELGCRHGVEIAWDGTLWDCDFNLAAGTRPPEGLRSVYTTPPDALHERSISFGAHCYACTAAAGSS